MSGSNSILSKPGQFSIFTACMNRNDNLNQALRSWLAHDEVGEVVIVDWSSDTQVADTTAELLNEKVKLVRVTNSEGHWISTCSFNLAARLTSNEHLLRIDADVLLKDGFFQAHVFDPDKYMTGNPEDDKGLTGMLYVHRKHFFGINGYNEFITSYGWEDFDLFGRLELDRGLRQDSFFLPGMVEHIPHSDEERTRHPLIQGYTFESLGELSRDALHALEKITARRVGSTYDARIKRLEELCNEGQPLEEVVKTVTSWPVFHNMKNRYLAEVKTWGPQYQQAQFEQISVDDRGIPQLRWSGNQNPAPNDIMKSAELYAFIKIFSWRHKNFICPISEFDLESQRRQNGVRQAMN